MLGLSLLYLKIHHDLCMISEIDTSFFFERHNPNDFMKCNTNSLSSKIKKSKEFRLVSRLENIIFCLLHYPYYPLTQYYPYTNIL